VPVDDDAALKGAVAHEAHVDERLLADERAQAVREALSRLPRLWQRLIELLMADPPTSYAEISDQLGLPVGSIGPRAGDVSQDCASCSRHRKQVQRGAALYPTPNPGTRHDNHFGQLRVFLVLARADERSAGLLRALVAHWGCDEGVGMSPLALRRLRGESLTRTSVAPEKSPGGALPQSGVRSSQMPASELDDSRCCRCN
jgi:hypothetical protein